jgi:hypothetical protein
MLCKAALRLASTGLYLMLGGKGTTFFGVSSFILFAGLKKADAFKLYSIRS